MSYLENSPLKYLKDNDVILLLLEYVENTSKYARIYHLKRNRRLHIDNKNLIFKYTIDNTFKFIYEQLQPTVKMVALIPSAYPFYRNPESNTINVKHAIQIYEKYKCK